MGNEQQGGTSHHFLMNTSNDASKERERETLPQVKQVSPSTARPSWQMARDISMDILSRKNTKLSLKPGILPNITSPRSLSKKYVPSRSSIVSELIPIHRIPRMPTEKEASEVTISYDALCSLCQGPGINDYIRCRVCPKTYHSKCLFKHGYTRNPSLIFPRLAKQDWSCPECNDLTRLLNEDELHHLIDAFEKIDRDKDGYIVLEEFLSLQTNKNARDGFELFIQYNADFGRKLFSLIDSTQKGVLTWADFAFFYSSKLIVVKDKTELTTKLTEKELVTARQLFLKDPKKTFDDNYNILITREYFNQIYTNLIQSLKKKHGTEFINMILSNDREGDDQTKKFSVMNWSEYLTELSPVMLLNRGNDDVICSQPRRASIPPHLSKAAVVSRAKTRTSSRLTLTGSITPAPIATATRSCDEVFLKHAKILEKLNRKTHEETLKKKQMGSAINFIIVENLDEQENLNSPKLKVNGRDNRKSITDPWTSVREIEQLRNQPIFVKTLIRT